jgi:2-(1,2-epoxy-1,2-dihydrophenyl)acetyl-CoA isomerase
VAVGEVLVAERDGGILTLTLNRPEAYNSFDPAMRDAVIDALDGAPGDGVRCVVIQGAGRGFSAGIDLKGDRVGPGYPTMANMRVSTQALVRSVLTCPVPIVTAVHGSCAGVSLVFALGADLCVAADDARFIASFVHRGLIPDGATSYLLPRLVGAAVARRILLLGEPVPARDAVAIGMISEVVPAAELAAAARARAEQFAALPAATIAYTKHQLLRSFEVDLESTLFEERAGQALMTTTDDFAEGVAAFLEKRPARFGLTP